MKVFTTFDSKWVCELLSKVLGVPIELGTIEESDILFEDVRDQMKYIYLKTWKIAGLISFEPFHHFSGPYDFIMCGNTEQCIGTKIVPFVIIDYDTNFGKKLLPPPKDIIVPKKFACAFVSNPMSDVRNRFMKMLIELNLLDSYGKLFHTIDEPAGLSMDQIISQYKFYICFENSSHEAYITEKPLAALTNHTIPVYYGATCASKYFNSKRVLIPENSSDDSLIDVIRRMIGLSRDDDAYKEFISAPVFVKNPVNSKPLESYAGKMIGISRNNELYKEIIATNIFIGGTLSPNSMDSYASQIRTILQNR
jgi:hypothetical protein